MKKPSKTFQRHMAALNSGVIGPAFIRGVTRAMNLAGRRERGYSYSRTYSGMSDDELNTLVVAIGRIQPRIEPIQSAKGLAWLRSKKVHKLLDDRQRDIVARFDRFTLVDLYDAGSGTTFMVPVYTVHATKNYLDPHDPRPGRSFTYRVGSWQSGVPFDIIE